MIEQRCSDITQYKRESLQHWLRTKPLPSWKCVAKALMIIGQFRVLKEVNRKYLKSEAVCKVACYFLVNKYCTVEDILSKNRTCISYGQFQQSTGG